MSMQPQDVDAPDCRFICDQCKDPKIETADSPAYPYLGGLICEGCRQWLSEGTNR